MKLSPLEKRNARVIKDTKLGNCDRFAMQEEDPLNILAFGLVYPIIKIISGINYLVQNPNYMEIPINYIKSFFQIK